VKKLKSVNGEWSSIGGATLTATGAVIGLGNIWKYSYIAGQNGGSAFLLLYMLCLFLFGLPLLMAELLMGKRGRASPPITFQKIAKDEGRSWTWLLVGVFSVIAGLVILSFYSVIAGWGLDYIWMSVRKTYEGLSRASVQGLFSTLNGKPWHLILWHTLFMGMTISIVARGVQDGIERISRMLVPVLFILMSILGLYAAIVGNMPRAMDYLFEPDFAAINGKVVLMALGSAFFTLSLGVGVMLAYGAYLPDDVSILRISIWIVLGDIVAALMSGIAIYPLVFANGLPVMQGPGLIFTILPTAFGHIDYGTFFGAVFYLTLVLAALTSAIALLEPAVAWWSELGMPRMKASLVLGGTVWLLGLLTVFSFNVWSSFLIFGHTWFGLLDVVSGNLMLPVIGLLVAIFVGWFMAERSLRKELGIRRESMRLWLTLLRYVTPIGMMLILLKALGLVQGGV